SVLAFFASYFLFPHWESGQLDEYMASVLKANINYLQKLKYYYSGSPFSTIEYKLVRKELYVNTANLSAALTRMLSEPKNKQQNAPEINEFVVLNNVLSSNIASLFAVNTSSEQPFVSKEILQAINRSVVKLEESLPAPGKSYRPPAASDGEIVLPVNKATDPQLKDHVDFIYKISVDIYKVVQKMRA
ncbi:MAG: hypothetical protein ABIS01_11785, partial [Ferruginibacter sp.]